MFGCRVGVGVVFKNINIETWTNDNRINDNLTKIDLELTMELYKATTCVMYVFIGTRRIDNNISKLIDLIFWVIVLKFVPNYCCGYVFVLLYFSVIW